MHSKSETTSTMNSCKKPIHGAITKTKPLVPVQMTRSATRTVNKNVAISNILRLLNECENAPDRFQKETISESAYNEIVRSRDVLFDVEPEFQTVILSKTKDFHEKGWEPASRFNMVLFGFFL
jgi:hypothetical protein